MGMALSYLSENQTLKNKIYLCSSFFLTDNQWLVGTLRKGLPACHLLNPLLTSVRELLDNVTTFKRPKVKWIPGHVSGAALAISLAKRGARIIRDSAPVVPQNRLPVAKLPSGVTWFEHSVLRDGLVLSF